MFFPVIFTVSGLPDLLLRKAAIKSQEFEGMYGKHQKQLEDKTVQSDDDDKITVLIQNFMNLAESTSCHESAESVVSSLNELQQRARILLEQN